MSNECRCGRPTRTGHVVCETCLTTLERALGEVPWLDAQLEVTISRQKGIDYRTVGGSKGGKKPAETPSPANMGASDARTHLRALLVSWTMLCHEEQVRHAAGADELPDDDLTALSRWLLTRVDGLGLHDDGADAVDEITSAVAHCHRLIDRPADQWFAGPCDECKADLYARVGATVVVCQACRLQYDVDERRDWLRDAAREHNATATEIARAVVVWGDHPPGEARLVDRIRKWADRDLIVERGHVMVRGTPRALYNVGDVLDRLADDARREQERRAKAC